MHFSLIEGKSTFEWKFGSTYVKVSSTPPAFKLSIPKLKTPKDPFALLFRIVSKRRQNKRSLLDNNIEQFILTEDRTSIEINR